MSKDSLLIRDSKDDLLRQQARKIEKVTPEIRALAKKMKKIMHEADGIGLAAPQVGIGIQLFVAEVEKKFYAICNPEITKSSKDKVVLEEGCLSLPEIFGPVERSKNVTITGQDLYGRKVKMRARGLLARVFQHEVDHLNGILFSDKAKELYRYVPKDSKK